MIYQIIGLSRVILLLVLSSFIYQTNPCESAELLQESQFKTGLSGDSMECLMPYINTCPKIYLFPQYNLGNRAIILYILSSLNVIAEVYRTILLRLQV
jgi:hypothetical protein